jgi:glycosyltransferase involved in cell wall biosynthesis
MTIGEDKLVSVIVPCFNVSEYVEQAVLSILNQSYRNLEIWLIDDASSDDTLAKISRFDDDRLRLISYEANTGKIGAVNDILQKVTGDFICFQDADDWSEPGKITRQVMAFHADSELGICFTGYRNPGYSGFDPRHFSTTDDELRNEFLHFGQRKDPDIFPTACATMMIKREVFTMVGGYYSYFKGRVGEDIYWIYRILKHVRGITINEVLYNYRIGRAGSFTDTQFSGGNAKSAYSWKLIEKIIRWNEENSIDLVASGHTDILRDLELEACEEALLAFIVTSRSIIQAYENSTSFKLSRRIMGMVRKILP